MKPRTLPVKRRPVTKGILKRLSAVTNHRKQRVAATAPSDMEIEDGSSKISRALTIIFLIHIVAIALIFVHKKFLDGRAPEPSAAAVTEAFPEVAIPPRRTDLPRLSTGETGHVVVRGDNYARIAATLGVDEGELRLINQHVDIIPGLVLKVPAKRAAAAPAPETAVITNPLAGDSSAGLVDAVDVTDAPRAQLVRPNMARAAGEELAAPVTASGKSYVVQNGDSIWRIANRFKVSQDALMKANGISDARKMKIGMNLVIPN
jgi:LysM repeat protein